MLDQPPAMIVVAPSDLAPALDPFLVFKRERMAVTLATLESILADASIPGDDPERLKRWIFDQWRAAEAAGGRLRYVLLVGDADLLPVRYMVLDRCTEAAFNYAFYPSDLYYADLAERDGSFEDWNAQKDRFHAHYYGEVRGECTKDAPINFDEVDYRPEVAVGRWPVQTAEQAAIVGAKSIAYERSIAGRHRGGVIAVGGWIENRPAMNALAAKLTSASWTMERLFYADPGSAAPNPPDEPHVIELLNSGAALVLHSGHGGDHVWEQSISLASLPRIANAEALPVVFSAGCSTARFATLPPYEAYMDAAGNPHAGTNAGEVFREPPPPPAPYQRGTANPTGLGEQLLVAGPSGVAAYIGCNTGSQPCGMTLMEGFVEAVARADGATVGECWGAAIDHYYERERLASLQPDDGWYPPSIFFQGMKFMLFGDPSAPMP